jgi:imidazolonepropionase-like amidohydrolase
LADLLVVDGNPLDDLKLIENPARNLSVIMKDGGIYKNTL